jgi:hypothetical protein
MTGRRLRRPWIGIALIAAFGTVSGMREMRSALVTYRHLERPDEITRYEARFRDVRAAVPRHGTVGYVSDAPPAALSDQTSVEARQSFKRYLLTQYALVPLVVLRGPDADLVIGDFATSGAAAITAPPGFVVVREFGNGVAVLRRVAK